MDIVWLSKTNEYTYLQPTEPPESIESVQFIASDHFVRSIQGYVFYRGPEGLGYYLDSFYQNE